MEELHNKLAQIILMNGLSCGKKHGSWIWLKITDDFFLEMDTWNRRIILREGCGEYCYWTGFAGLMRIHFGICWGGFESHTKEWVYKYFIERLS